jgi:cation diffusion facilitator family transporter
MDYARARKVLIYTLVLNWLVALAKFAYGAMTLSASMAADGMHSFADGTNNIIGLIGFYFAGRPVDKTHPYGHEKYETLTALGIGALLLIVAFDLVKDSIQRFAHPVIPEVNLGSFLVMFITVAVNIFVMIYENREGKKLKSDFLVTDSIHTKSDILASCSVIVTLFAVRMGMPIIDTFVAGFIALFIGYSGVEVLYETSKVLSDHAMIEPEKLRQAVSEFKEINSCHKIRSRGREDSICVDLHVHVRPSMRTDEAHELSHQIENKIKQEFPGVREVIIHIEPTDPSDS